MELKTLVKEIFEIVLPIIKMEAVQDIEKDFKDATNGTVRELWQKVKPLFIEETEDLKKDPEDADNQGAARKKLAKALEGKDDFQQELLALLQQAQKEGGGLSSVITNSKNVVVGSTVAGNLQVGDSNISNVTVTTGDVGKMVNVGTVKGDLNL